MVVAVTEYLAPGSFSSGATVVEVLCGLWAGGGAPSLQGKLLRHGASMQVKGDLIAVQHKLELHHMGQHVSG